MRYTSTHISELTEYLEQNDVSNVKAFLELYPQCFAYIQQYTFPIECAIRHRNTELANYLLDNNARTAIYDMELDRETVLFMIDTTLIENNVYASADYMIQSKDKVAIRHFIAKYTHRHRLVDELIRYSIDGQSWDMLYDILDQKEFPYNVTTELCQLVLSKHHHLDIIQYLFNHYTITYDAIAVLKQTVLYNKNTIFQYLFPLSPKDDIVNNIILLTHIIDQGNLELLTWMVEHGTDIEIELQSGHTLLSMSARGGQLELVTYLLEKGALMKNALHGAIIKNRFDVVVYLVTYGADLGVLWKGKTPLVTAINHQAEHIIRFLKRYEKPLKLYYMDAFIKKRIGGMLLDRNVYRVIGKMMG